MWPDRFFHFVIGCFSPTAMGELRTSAGIQTGLDPFFSLPNDKEKKAVWPRETMYIYAYIQRQNITVK